MRLSFSSEEETFRQEVSDWLTDNLCGNFEELRYRGGPGDEHMYPSERKQWEKCLATGGWTCVGWPTEFGGRGLNINQQVIFHEEYARHGAPGRMGHMGETLAGPTIISFGSEAQKQRFLPNIVAGEDFWCQGYSEPSAGSDLANVQTRARWDKGSKEWIITGQKIWTSLAHEADWCFVLCRSEEGSQRHKGLSFLLVPMSQAGIEVRPIQQLTGTSEFNEVFFDGARTDGDCVVGKTGEGWQVAMGTLSFERGVSTLGQQMQFKNELLEIIRIAKANGQAEQPTIRQRLAKAWQELLIMRYNALRMLSGDTADVSITREAMIAKLYWANWHRDLGKLAMDVLGDEAEFVLSPPYNLSRLQSLFLFSRSDTIYAGSNEIQRNIISERALAMPREPRPTLSN